MMFFGYFLVSRQESNRGRGQSPIAKQNNAQLTTKFLNEKLRWTAPLKKK